MVSELTLDKTNRMNLLIDFYGTLLTDKQRSIVERYFYEDYSLGEIAEQLQVSRQAVFEHIKRANVILEQYEDKLQLLNKHGQRTYALTQLVTAVDGLPKKNQESIRRWVDFLQSID